MYGKHVESSIVLVTSHNFADLDGLLRQALQEEVLIVERFLNNHHTLTFKQFIDEDVRKMPDGGFGVYADKFKTVKIKLNVFAVCIYLQCT